MILQLGTGLQPICQSIEKMWRTKLHAGSIGLPPCLYIVRKQQRLAGHTDRMPAYYRLGTAPNISSDRDLRVVWLQQMFLSAVLDQDHRTSNQQD